jgi:cytochrome c biogenesis protein CcmG/thiol:disulfide interchange protein DsbE
MEELFSRDRKVPKGFLILVPALAFLIILGIGTYKRTDTPTAGKGVPDFTAPLLIGEGDLSLSDLKGTPVVINFWASWCAPCEDEAPLFKKAFEEYGDRIAFLGVDIRDARTDAIKFIADYDIAYPSVRDEGMEIYADYGLTGQPETFFIDAEGVLVEHVPGPVDEEGLFQILDVLIRRDA